MSDNLAPAGTPPMPLEEDKTNALPAESITGQQTPLSTAEPQATEPPAEKELPSVVAEEATTLDSEFAASGTTEPEEQPKQEETPETEQTGEVSAPRTDMHDVFSDEYTYPRAKRGDIRQGRIIASNDEGMMVDLGLKREGLIPAHDLQRVGPDIVQAVSIGDEIPVFIVRPEHDQEGHIIVSWHRARQEQDWIDAQRLYDTGDIWEGGVKGYNRGGLIVPYGKIRGFIPASHVTGISRRMGQASLQARLAEMVGHTLPLKVLEVNRQKRRLIFSERIARRQWRAQQREKLLSELQEGHHVHGVVSNVCDFGVFVDIGGTDGLVHISELSWRRTKHPSEVVRIGDEVDAYVLRVDRERKRIGLSLRLMEPDPWEAVEENYHVGQLVTGVVTKLTDFGAFAALEDGIEGLIHISELAEVPPRHPSEVITPDTVLPLLIVKVDSRRRRMGLSLKRVSEEEWFEWEEQRRAKAQVQEAEPSEEPEPDETEAGGEPHPEDIEGRGETEPVGEIEPTAPGPQVEEVVEPELTPEEAPAFEAAAEISAAEPPIEAGVEPELTPEEAPAFEAADEISAAEPPIEAGVEPELTPEEGPPFEPPDEISAAGPPIEAVLEPELTPEEAPAFEPPDEIPIGEPPPEEEDSP